MHQEEGELLERVHTKIGGDVERLQHSEPRVPEKAVYCFANLGATGRMSASERSEVYCTHRRPRDRRPSLCVACYVCLMVALAPSCETDSRATTLCSLSARQTAMTMEAEAGATAATARMPTTPADPARYQPETASALDAVARRAGGFPAPPTLLQLQQFSASQTTPGMAFPALHGQSQMEAVWFPQHSRFALHRADRLTI